MNHLNLHQLINLLKSDNLSFRRSLPFRLVGHRIRNLSGCLLRFLPSVEMTILVYMMFIVGLIPESLYAQNKSSSNYGDWSIDLTVTSAYDNNILKYSDKYIERFKNREDAGRFHINRYDDLLMNYDVRVACSNWFIKNLRTIFSASADHKAYSYNSSKSWSSFDFGIQQYVTSSTSLMFSYSYLPEFYVAHFRDDDWINLYGYTPETFQPYTFSKDEYALWLQQNIVTSTRVRLYFSYMKYFYNEHFTEYDSQNMMYGIRLFQDISKIVTADAGYRYITSDAKGYDEDFETKTNSDDVDATYHEHIFFAGIDVNLPKLMNKNNSVSLSGQFSKRLYKTENIGELDPLHAGRFDVNYRINFNYDIKLLNNFSAGLFYAWMYRDTDTSFQPNEEYVSDEKDYDQSQFGLILKYGFQF